MAHTRCSARTGQQEFAQISHDAEQAMIAVMDVDPTLGLYSQTAAMQGPLAQDTLMARAREILSN